MAHADAQYVPRRPPVGDITRWLEDELLVIARALQTHTVVQLDVLHAAPERPRVGMVVYADGTHWNPAAGGEGLYVFKSGGWTLIA